MTPPTQREPSPDKPGIPASVGKRAAALGGQIGFTTLFIILAALFGGLWLDNQFGTKPLITILIVLGTVPVSLALTYRMARQAIKDYEATHKKPGNTPAAETQPAASRNNQSKEGDETGE
jgi:hypothetical protein